MEVTDSLDDFEGEINVLENVDIHNDIANWNCQDWVLEALEKLKDEEIISDDDYERVERKLTAVAGANDEAD